MVEPLPFGSQMIDPRAIREEAAPEGSLPEELYIALDPEKNSQFYSIEIDDEESVSVEEYEDGSATVNLSGSRPDKLLGIAHDANLAEHLPQEELGRLCDELLRGVQDDEQSRSEWLETRSLGLKLLGLKLKNTEKKDESSATVSTIDHPLLLESVLTFQANARGELLPSEGPVKVTEALPSLRRGLNTKTSDDLAEMLQPAMNYWLTKVATEYVPDTDRMFFMLGFGGCGFKKVYRCPIRRRPVIESVDARDLIVSNTITDLANAGRYTHRIPMRPSVLRRMQLVKAYRNVDVSTPNMQMPNVVESAEQQITGVVPNQTNPNDYLHTILEVYAELDIRGLEHEEDGKPTGLALPYVVTIEKDSQVILAIRRDWKENDPLYTPRRRFVKYPFIPGLGFYDLGLVHVVGNTTNALTAAWRELLDAGMFANFPGFLYAKSASRQMTNNFAVMPGSGTPIDTMGLPISDAVMPLPYRDPSPAFASIVQSMGETGSRLAGSAQMVVAEGRAEAPVGTTLAIIEQAMKMMSAVHKRICTAQAEEFSLLRDLLREDPSAFLTALQNVQTFDEKTFVEALNRVNLEPVADPNTPSHSHRLMKATAIKQLQTMNPALYDARKVDSRILSMIKIENYEDLFAPPQANAAPDPAIMMQMQEQQTKLQIAQINAKVDEMDLALRAALAERQSLDKRLELATRENIAKFAVLREVADTPDSEDEVLRTSRNVVPTTDPGEDAQRPPSLQLPRFQRKHGGRVQLPSEEIRSAPPEQPIAYNVESDENGLISRLVGNKTINIIRDENGNIIRMEVNP